MARGTWRLILACALAMVGGAAAYAEDAHERISLSVGGLHLDGNQPDPLSLVLDYDMAPPIPVARIEGEINSTALPEPKLTPYPAEGQTTAILFLIDTSDPARKKVVDAVVRDVRAMIGHAQPYHRLGLATFDSAMTMRAEVGASPEAMQRALAAVLAAGKRTELFRRGAEAVLKLAEVKSTRKALFLFSDGRAEDDPKAYPLSYMADTAITADVRVYAFCYTGVAPPPISCQNLSRLAEETGGVYFAASRALTLPAEATAAPFIGIDNGGRAVFDLAPAAAALIGGKRDLRLVAELTRASAASSSPSRSSCRPCPSSIARSKTDNLPWTGAAVAAILAIIGLSIYAAFFLLRQRHDTVALQHPVAYLEFLDGDGTRHPMIGGALRIGRSAGNEVRLANTSVSAHHAEIHRRRDGTFIITDLKSMNGVAVNEAKVATAELHDGDEIDLGEVRFRFFVNHAAPAPAAPYRRARPMLTRLPANLNLCARARPAAGFAPVRVVPRGGGRRLGKGPCDEGLYHRARPEGRYRDRRIRACRGSMPNWSRPTTAATT